MAKRGVARRGAGLAHPIVLPMVLLLAACGPRFGGPAPVVNGGESLSQNPAQVVIEHGQTLSGIARRYRVPMQAIAAANHLSPPYRILAGGTLIIPGGGVGSGGPPVATPVAMVPPPPVASPPEAAVATTPLPPQQPELASRAAPPAADRDRPIPLVGPVTAEPRPEITSRTPDQQADRALPPDRAPPSGFEASSTPPAASGATLTPPVAPLAPTRAETPRVASAEPAAHPTTAPGAAATAEPPPAAHRGGTFLWPVRGHILESYGAGPDGTHNDGINIGAARGAPVQATDAGVVAYAGNELRGYGNLVLIKHPNGWISAYAHCDLILVKTGQKVARGQVIARVGSTGNVKEPQLHFELRRGKRPVDPRDYLAPLPSAATRAAHAG